MKQAGLYDTDFYEWSQETAQLIREGRFAEADRDAVAEEIESLGRSDKREVVSRLRVLIMHLLQWQTQPGERSGSWRGTIRTQRNDLNDVLNDSPSLRARLPESIASAYPRAAELAVEENATIQQSFPRRVSVRR